MNFKNYHEEVNALEELLNKVGVPYRIELRSGHKHGAMNVQCYVEIDGKEYYRNSAVGYGPNYTPYTSRGATYAKVARLLKQKGLLSEELEKELIAKGVLEEEKPKCCELTAVDIVVNAIKNGKGKVIEEKYLTPEILFANAGEKTVLGKLIDEGYRLTRLDLLKTELRYHNTIAHWLVEEKGIFFDPDKEREVLMIGKGKGNTVAHSMAWRGFKFDPIRHRDLLKLKNAGGESVAHWCVKYAGMFFDPEIDRDILELKDEKGITVAHVMAWEGFIFDPEKYRDILAWKADGGYTVAHAMAKAGYVFDPEKYRDILLWATEDGYTVAHAMAEEGYVFDKHKYRDILKLKELGSYTVAYRMAQNGYFFDPDEDRDIFFESIGIYDSLAHVQASKGFIFDPVKHEDILKITITAHSDRGYFNWSVAHEMACKGFLFDAGIHPESVINLKARQSWIFPREMTVIEVFFHHRWREIRSGALDDKLLSLTPEGLMAYIKAGETEIEEAPLSDREKLKETLEHLRELYEKRISSQHDVDNTFSMNL